MEITEINKRLIGHIGFYGETNYDKKSLENLEEMENLILNLVNEIILLKNSTEGRLEASAIDLNKKSKYILDCILEEIGGLK